MRSASSRLIVVATGLLLSCVQCLDEGPSYCIPEPTPAAPGGMGGEPGLGGLGGDGGLGGLPEGPLKPAGRRFADYDYDYGYYGYDIVECDPGHVCEAIEGEEEHGQCSEECYDVLCSPGSECRDGECYFPDHCGRTLPCASTKEVCDPVADRCFPRNGTCSEDLGCPQFRGNAANIAQNVCDLEDSTCHLVMRATGTDWIDTAGERVTARVLDQDPWTFGWDAGGRGVILRLLDRFPFELADWQDGARWQAAGGSSHKKKELADGDLLAGGAWSPAGSDLPGVGRYYLVVVSVLPSGRPAGVSVPVVVDIQSQSLSPEEQGPPAVCETDGQCFDPSIPFICENQRCRRLCAAHADCSERGFCRDYADGYRSCSQEG